MPGFVTLPGRPSATALISTKYRPPVTGRAMPRSRLLGLLESTAADGRQIILVAAPAGSGKTTLLVTLAESSERPVAWLNLDEGDNDPARFLSYLLAAIDRVAPGIMVTAQGMVASEYPPPTEAILTEMINAIDQHGPLLVVLDDYHAISEPAVHEILTFLIDYLPAHAQIVLSSRHAPGLPLARARARGRVLDLTLDDLRFTMDEMRGLVARWSGQEPGEPEIAELNARTEGWVAGLAAVLSLAQQRSSGVTGVLASSEEQVAEYLAGETLRCLAPRLLEFLVKTSILDRLCDDICAVVTGFDDARELLDEAQRSILFITPLDENRRFRRYHALFARALRNRLERDYREEIPALHRRAALWFAANGDDVAALSHALAADDCALAASIVTRNAGALLAHGEMRTVRSWIERLPRDRIANSVDIALPYAWALAQSGELEAAETQLAHICDWIDRARSGDPAALAAVPDLSAAEGQVAALRSRIAALRDDPHETIRWTRRALDLMPDGPVNQTGDARHRGGVLLNLGHALGRLGDLDGAADAFGQAAALGPEAGPLLAALGRRYQAGVEIARGRLGAAWQLYRQAYELALARGFGDRPATGIILEGMADLAYLRNDLDDAMRLAADALERGTRGGEVKISVPAHVVMARALAARGDLDGAIDQIDSASALSHWPSTDAWRARFLLRAGDIACAQRWATESGCDAVDSLEGSDEFVMITYVRVLDAIGRNRERDWLLAALRERAVALGRVTSRIELDLLIAQAAAAGGRMDEAIDRLLLALSAGEQAGHIRLFLDEGPRLGPLLARAERAIDGSDHQPTPGYVARLRTLLAAEQPAPAEPAPANGGLIEPLTPREREVLQLIADGQSNRAIADALYLSLGSVKTHSSHVYGKLGVRGRTEAVARARALGLLG